MSCVSQERDRQHSRGSWEAEGEPRGSLVSPEETWKLDELRAWELVMGLLWWRGGKLWEGHCLEPL